MTPRKRETIDEFNTRRRARYGANPVKQRECSRRYRSRERTSDACESSRTANRQLPTGATWSPAAPTSWVAGAPSAEAAIGATAVSADRAAPTPAPARGNWGRTGAPRAAGAAGH